MRFIVLVCAAALAGCVSIEANTRIENDALRAINTARVRECPPERTQAGARSGMEGAAGGVTAVDLAFTPLASDPTRQMRLRRITIAPGGTIAWHEHGATQGIGMVVSGEMTEYRNNCLDAIVHRAGDIVREDPQTAHGWRNLSGDPAVILVTHVLAR